MSNLKNIVVVGCISVLLVWYSNLSLRKEHFVAPSPSPASPPPPIHGKCPGNQYQYGMYNGGFCCTEKPTNWKEDKQDYDNCPSPGKICSLSSDPGKRQGYPLCPPKWNPDIAIYYLANASKYKYPVFDLQFPSSKSIS